MNTHRLFIAIERPESLKDTQTQVQAHFKGIKAVRWTNPEQCHLTLQFLGDTPVTQTDRLLAALSEAITPLSPFNLHLDRLGFFPNSKRPRIVWVGLGGEIQALLTLHQAIIKATHSLGLPSDKRPFKAHITLGRIQKQATTTALAQLSRLVDQHEGLPKSTFTVDQISLIRSQLQPSGPIYTTLAETDLLRHNRQINPLRQA